MDSLTRLLMICFYIKGKGQVIPLQARDTRRGEWSAARPGKTRYPLYRRLGEPQGRPGRAENLASSGFDPRTVHPVISRYTDCDTGPQ
jgi:hypothetical protein